MQKLFYIFAWIGIFSAIIIVLTVGFWTLYPYKIIEFNGIPSIVSESSYKRGTPLAYTTEYCQYVDVPAEIVIQFIDEISYTLPPHTGSFVNIGCGRESVQIMIPETLPVAEYKISVTHRYQVNPIRSVVIRSETNKFFVTE